MATSRNTPSKRPASGRPTTGRGTTPRPRAAEPASWSPLANVPEKYHTPIYIALVAISLIVFFGGIIFGGKFFATSDNISWLSFVPFLDQMAARGEHPFWIPYIFSGMPAYAAYLVAGDRWWDISMKVISVAEHMVGFDNFYMMRVILHYFIYGTGMYLLMRTKQAARSTSLFVALAAMFSAWVIVYIMIGHNTKISVVMTFPFIFIFIHHLMKRWSLLYAGLLILGIHALIEQNHPQTAFYGAFAVGIYMLFELVGGLVGKRKEATMGAVRTGAILVVAVAMSYGMGLDRFNALAEYTPYSTRANHDYKYATEYSFSPEESITYVVPSFYGSGKMWYSEGGQEQHVPTYWGQMLFTDTAHYAGIAVLLLAMVGLWAYRRQRFVQAMLGVGLFGLFLSFGGNFPALFNLIYNNVPRFNNFRAPSQALIMLEFVLPILAGFGLMALAELREREDAQVFAKKLLRGLIGFGGLMLFGLILVNVMKTGYMGAIEAAAKAKNLSYLTQLQDFIFKTMQLDWILSLVFGCATLLLAYLYMNRKVSYTLFMGAMFAILIVDLWRVDYRAMDAVPKEEAFRPFTPTDVDAFLHKDTTKYRIMDLTAENPNFVARQLHEHILGYHAAKMRIVQDLLDSAGNGQIPTSPLAWRMLNTKYIVAGGMIAEGMTPVFQSRERQTSDGKGGAVPAVVLQLDNALPRAWFVNRVEVTEPKSVLGKIRDNAFDPQDVAFVAKAPTGTIEPVGYMPGTATAASDSAAHDSTGAPPKPAAGGTPGAGTVTIADWTPNHFTLNVDAPGNNFLVVSEIYYGPSWEATIDGKPTEIYQTNYLLRGVVVPKGKHAVEMRYVSPGFETAKNISLGLNLAMFAMIGVGYFMDRKRRAGAAPEAEPEPPAPAPPTPPAPPAHDPNEVNEPVA